MMSSTQQWMFRVSCLIIQLQIVHYYFSTNVQCVWYWDKRAGAGRREWRREHGWRAWSWPSRRGNRDGTGGRRQRRWQCDQVYLVREPNSYLLTPKWFLLVAYLVSREMIKQPQDFHSILPSHDTIRTNHGS